MSATITRQTYRRGRPAGPQRSGSAASAASIAARKRTTVARSSASKSAIAASTRPTSGAKNDHPEVPRLLLDP